MKKILSVLLAICTVLTTLCIPPALVTAQSSEMLVSDQINETVTLPAEEESISFEALTEECKILQYVDEEAFEAADHAFRLPYLEELDTYVFQNQDGTRSIYYLYENVKYIDEQGNIREKDNTLQREIKGFRITENEFDLLLPHAVTDGVELTYQDYDVKLIPATEGKLTATAPGTLQDNSVVYESFFGAGTSLVYTPLLSGVKEEIILEEYLPNQSFSFLLYTDGLYVTESEGRYILTQTKTSAEAVLYLGDIVVYDAIGRPSLGNLTVETVKDGNIYALTVSADEGFLSDPATVYPVTIDPDLTISDTTNGSGAIEDTTLFSGTPNLNTGDWVYNTAGYVDDTYGAGRILVRLPGLYNSTVFQGLEPNDINSCIFYCNRTSIKSTESVKLYLSNGAWTESTATWSNFGNGSNYYSGTAWSTVAFNGTALSFNISALVRAWKRGTYSASNGFVLINDNETGASYKCGVYSSEHSNTEKRPYFVMNYDADIVLDKAELEVKLGTFGTLNATTTPANQQVYWRSSNEAVASVTPSGVVAPYHAGTTTITAWFTDSDGVDHEATCDVTIYLPNAVYYVQNTNSHYYLSARSAGISQGTDVNQYFKHDTSAVTSHLLAQMWRFFYLGDGRYSIRPMHKLDMGLDVYGGNVDLEPIGTSDTQAGVPDYCEWVLEWDATGYLFRNNGYVSRTMQVKDASTSLVATVVVGAYANVANCKWSLIEISDPPVGVLLYDIDTERVLDDPTYEVRYQRTYSMESLGLIAVAYSPTELDQSFDWDTDKPEIVSVDKTSGNFNTLDNGIAHIIGTKKVGETTCTIQYTVEVKNKAIIIVPGIMGSELIAGPTNTTYEPGTEIWSSSIEDGGIYEAIERLFHLRCDSDGTTNNDIVVKSNSYGYNDMYQPLYESLNETFGSEYEVEFFAYDWRLHNAFSSLALSNFIDSQKYSDVVLVCHSMGGLVASNYLSLSESRREKTEKVVMLGSPLLGTPVIPMLWASEDISLINEGMSHITDNPLYAAIMGKNDPVDFLLRNFRSIYELFPSEKYFLSGYGQHMYLYDNTLIGWQGINTYEETKEVLGERFAWYRASFVEKAESFHASMYIGAEHITYYVDTYYIAGRGIATINEILSNEPAEMFYEKSTTVAGDGTVVEWSATLGDRYPEKTYYASGVNHSGLISDGSVLTFVNNIIAGTNAIPPNTDYVQIEED